MSPSPTRVPAARAAGRRRRSAALVPAAALLVASLGVAGAPAHANDAPAPAAEPLVLESSGTALSAEALAQAGLLEGADGTAPAALIDNHYTHEFTVAPLESVDFRFTNSRPISPDPRLFAPGKYWSVIKWDHDSNLSTTADQTWQAREYVLTETGQIGDIEASFNGAAGDLIVFTLYKVPDWAEYDYPGGRGWSLALAGSVGPLDTITWTLESATFPSVGTQVHVHGASRSFTYHQMPDRLFPGQVFYGDWDGDGVDTLGYRVGATFHLASSNASNATFREVNFGRMFDIAYVGDWDGDGVDTFGVRRGNTFYLTNDFNGGAADVVTAYGRTLDTVYIGDWDGNGTDTPSVRRGNEFHLKNAFTGGNADTVTAYGRVDDEVVVGDWNGDGVTTPGVRRGNTFMLKNDFLGGNADQTFDYGKPSDSPLVADWDGDGKESILLYRR